MSAFNSVRKVDLVTLYDDLGFVVHENSQIADLMKLVR